MNSLRLKTNVFAFFILIFFNLNFVYSQAENNSSIYELPAGTIFKVQMDNGISSKSSSVKDTFTVTVIEPVKVREAVVVPIGTTIQGIVVKTKPASIGNKNGLLSVSFDSIRFATGESRDIKGELASDVNVRSSHGKSALILVGGIAVGGILGSISNADNGALIGMGIGAGAGAGIGFLRKGKEIVIPTDEKFAVKLMEAVTLPVRDF